MSEPSLASAVDQIKSLVDKFSCFVCLEEVKDARLCPHCSKLCCFPCIKPCLERSGKCPHCSLDLQLHQLVNCRWAQDVSQSLDRLHQDVVGTDIRLKKEEAQRQEANTKSKKERQKRRRLRDETIPIEVLEGSKDSCSKPAAVLNVSVDDDDDDDGDSEASSRKTTLLLDPSPCRPRGDSSSVGNGFPHVFRNLMRKQRAKPYAAEQSINLQKKMNYQELLMSHGIKSIPCVSQSSASSVSSHEQRSRSSSVLTIVGPPVEISIESDDDLEILSETTLTQKPVEKSPLEILADEHAANTKWRMSTGPVAWR